MDILHANRSLIWFNPDHIVVDDRAVSKTANRFKCSNPCLSVNLIIKSHKFFIHTLIPKVVSFSILPDKQMPKDAVAVADPIQYRFRVDGQDAHDEVIFPDKDPNDE